MAGSTQIVGPGDHLQATVKIPSMEADATDVSEGKARESNERVPETVLKAEGISKRYTLWSEPIDRLRAPIVRRVSRMPLFPRLVSRWLAGRADRMAREFAALQDVSFEVKRGESLGIIGRNGAGKSTLLQILAGTLQPTTGRVYTNGRVAALLELGSGFNGEFTGRENVYLQAALAGIAKREVDERFTEVAAFANIGEFVEQPVKVYSTGMMLRLAFATQTILEPDIFIVDEALAVGDVFFISKCTRFFERRLEEGMSLILVSHDIPAVKALCQRALVLDEGKPVFLGDCNRAESVFHEIYEDAQRRKMEGIRTSRSERSPTELRERGGVSLPPQVLLRNWPAENEIGSREAEIIHCHITDEEGNPRLSYFQGETVGVDIYVEAREVVRDCHFSIQVSDSYNNVIYGVSTINLKQNAQTLKPDEIRRWRVQIEGVGLGKYLIDALIFLGDRGDGCPVHHLHRIGGIAAITVGQRGLRPRFVGLADLKAKVEFE